MTGRASRVSSSLALLGTVVTCALLGWSIRKDVPHSWRLMATQYGEFHGYTRLQRDQAYGAFVPLDMSYFEWYRQYLRPGDRYYIQIRNGAFGRFVDKETAVRRVAYLYLLPALEARDLRHASVVLSWDAVPTDLPVRYSSNVELGLQLFFVSRIDRAR